MGEARWIDLAAIAVGMLVAWAATHIIDAPPMTGDDWATWIQALGSIAAILVAIAVPAWLELRRQQREQDALIERQRAAWQTLHALVAVLGRKPTASAGEVRAIGAVLDHVDASAFPEHTIPTLVGVHNWVAVIVSELEGRSVRPGERHKMPLSADAQLANLEAIRETMGMGETRGLSFTLRRFLRAKRTDKSDGVSLTRFFPRSP